MQPTPEQLEAYLTSYDNSGEPKPVWNYPQTIYGITISFMLVSVLCALPRLFVRFKERFAGWDDFWLVLTCLSMIMYSIAMCVSVQYGFGDHFLNAEQLLFQKTFYVAVVGYALSTAFIKLCLLSQYLRLFKEGSKTRMVTIMGICIVSLWGFAFSFIAIFPCFPIYGFWNWYAEATCYGFGSKIPEALCATFVAHAASNTALDIFVLGIPMPLYLKKHKTNSWRQQLGVYGLIFVGFAVVVVSVCRLVSLIQHRATTYPVFDPTWYGPEMILLAVIEVDLSAIASSVPVFWPLVEESIGRIFVTKEVEVTHQRLSGDEDDDAQEIQSGSGDETLNGSCLNLVTTPEKVHTAAQEGKPQGFQTDYQFVPPNEAKSEFQVSSEGAKAFKKQQELERSTTPQPKPMNNFHHPHFFEHRRTASRQRAENIEMLRQKGSSSALSGRTYYEDAKPGHSRAYNSVDLMRDGTGAVGPARTWPSNPTGLNSACSSRPTSPPIRSREPERGDQAFFL